MHVLLAVAAVSKASVTAFKFTFERFLTCKRQKCKREIRSGPVASQREMERPAVFPEREFLGRLWHLFSLERNGKRWYSPLGCGVVIRCGGGAGPA
jgi:hypothetical protein